MTKPRIHPYVSVVNYTRLNVLASQPFKTESGIVDEALDAYFASSPDGLGGHAILRGMDRLTGQFDRLERNDLLIGETLALFIRYFMMTTPPVPAERQEAARAAGDLRFESFVDQLGIELQAGRRLLQRALETILLDEADLLTSNDLDQLHQPAPDRTKRSAADA